ncbi:MAG: type II toxin-antitoxin system PemK/MazF family toxin [Verrucomicrobiota bacterium]|nr:type II toxin-antitoxin system PemK/MazF family toxin [Verrucomicrobiota bacterium]
MPAAKPGDIWIVDLGMVAKVRPCLILTTQPRGDDLEVFTVVAHTTSLRGNHWEVLFQNIFSIAMARSMCNASPPSPA